MKQSTKAIGAAPTRPLMAVAALWCSKCSPTGTCAHLAGSPLEGRPANARNAAMRRFGSIVRIPALPVLDARRQLSPSHAIAAQLVRQDHVRLILQAHQQPFEEMLGDVGIPSRQNQDVELHTILVERAPDSAGHPGSG